MQTKAGRVKRAVRLEHLNPAMRAEELSKGPWVLPPEIPRNPEGMASGDTSNQTALRAVLGLGGAALAGGAGLRALVGLRDMLRRSRKERRRVTNPAVVEIGVPTMAPKMAAATPEITPDINVINERLSKNLATNAANAAGLKATDKNIGFLSPGWMAGRTHESWTSKPWFWPAAIGLGAGGGYLGWKALDSILDWRKKNEEEDELEEAKNDYRSALVEQYAADSPSLRKTGSANDLGKDLTELYGLVKEAGIGDILDNAGDTLNNAGGAAIGAYLPLAALLAGGSGLAAYNWTKSRSPEARLAKALEQRERVRWASKPPEIYAVTRPVPVGIEEDEEEEDLYSPGTERDQALVEKYSEIKRAAAYVANLYY